ncbi:MAG: response regulator transcription factor [Chloroflexia bacterium]|nr:response regulator transcription factor [Chloroflexia bacterium]
MLIVDDHPLFRQGVRATLDKEADFEVVGEAADGQQAIQLAEEVSPNIVLIDISLPGLNGLEVARVIKRRQPQVSLVLLTVYEDDEQLFSAIKAGASAYTSKDLEPQKLLQVVREIGRGKYLIDEHVFTKPHIATRVLHQFRELAAAEEELGALFSPLTTRETEILDCIAQGLSNKEIADRLCISSQTVKNHVTSILRKLQVNDRTSAVIYALRRGWIRLGSPHLPPDFLDDGSVDDSDIA